MARQLKWWVGAALLVCAAAGVALLPPRGAPFFGHRYREMEPLPPYRLRVQQLADAWRSTALELRLLRYREQLRPELNRRRALEIPGPAVLVDWPGAPDSARRRVAALEREWGELGLGVSKISVGVVVAFDSQPAADRPREPSVVTAYLLPDSTDRSTCIAFYRFARPGKALPPLGLCAYYAAFGTPGREIGAWLGRRNYDLASSPRWRPGRTGGGPDPLLDRNNQWFWWEVYHYQPDGIACLAGRREHCGSAVLSTPQPGRAPSHVVTQEPIWWLKAPALAGGAHYLADVVRAVGHDRFLRFWSSELSPDTALAEALRMPVGEWTRQWQAGVAPRIRLGPAPSAGSALFGLLLAAAALGFVLRTVARREVR